jgi:regulator of ribonuclease activity A
MSAEAGFSTCDLYDRFESLARVPRILLPSFGGRPAFHGPIVTVRCREDNSKVKELCSTEGKSRVLVVDGAGSLACALLGDLIGAAAVKHGWAGIVVHGCVRDRAALAQLDIGIRALGTVPAKSVRKGAGEVDVPLEFAGVRWSPGDHLFADEDGLLLLDAVSAAAPLA